MTTPDRTEELVLEMLGRRAGGEPPPELLGRTLRELAATPQARTARRVGAGARRGRSRGVLAAAALVVALPVLIVVLLVAGPVILPPGGPGGIAAEATPGSPSPSGDAPGGTASASRDPGDIERTPPTTGASPDPGLAPGTVAVVTLDGTDLRVRSLPTTDNSRSKKYTPVLPAGTRLLIVGGPVTADDMTWYEVQTDGELIDLFGWVSSGDLGETWIEPRPPRCPEHVDAATIATLTRTDFLACYGDTPVTVQAKVGGLWDPRTAGPSCGWVRVRKGTECRVDNRWLAFPDAAVTMITERGNQHDIVLAMPPDYAAALLRLPRQSTALLTISMDAPEAEDCRIRDRATGKHLVTIDHAVTRCRLQFVVQEVRVRSPGTPGPASPEP